MCFRSSSIALASAVLLSAPVAHAGEATLPRSARSADVVFLGEYHDNPAHHRMQAEWVAALQPAALVFEMLTPEQATRVLFHHRTDPEKLEQALGWAGSGWPDFSMYYPIFAAAPDAEIFGAGIPREQLGTLMAQGLAHVAGDLVTRFGLDEPLPAVQQTERELIQMTAHCDALPTDLLPGMVDAQRWRDALLADTALTAFLNTDGPVVVITGNGHARRDWGAPFLLQQTRSGLDLFTLGQSEAGLSLSGGFDDVVQAPVMDRDDPCEAFK